MYKALLLSIALRMPSQLPAQPHMNIMDAGYNGPFWTKSMKLYSM